MVPMRIGEVRPIGKKIKVDKKNSAENILPWEIVEAQYFVYALNEKEEIQIETGKCLINQNEKIIYHMFTAKQLGVFKITYIVNLNPNIGKYTNYIKITK